MNRFTLVDILGGTIHRNVYGGGSRASVGPPMIFGMPGKRDPSDLANQGKQSQCTVNVSSTVGTPGDDYNEVYGGEVYGGSRGDSEVGDTFATTVWTLVFINHGATIMGNVFGGGDAGVVKGDAKVVVGNTE